MAKSRPLVLERLEDRCTPSTSGITWPDGQHLTLSFVPDGTRVAGYQSSLFRTLDAVAPTATWQREILRAFQTWAANANLNVGVVADGGQSLGTGGAGSGDVIVNASYLFGIGGGAGRYDLYTAMLNEAGNVFGVLDSKTDTASGVYYQYIGPKAGIDTADAADIRALY